MEDEGTSAVSFIIPTSVGAARCTSCGWQAHLRVLLCPRAHQTASLRPADFMKSVDNVPRSLACIFDGHKTEEAAELAASNLASVLQTRESSPTCRAPSSLLALLCCTWLA